MKTKGCASREIAKTTGLAAKEMETYYMKDFATYIFDLDGTLLDTLDDLAASTNYALRQHDMPEHSLDDVRRFVGNGVGVLIGRAVPQDTPPELTARVLATFRRHYLEHGQDRTRPYPGIPEMLRELRARGKRVAVVSNKFYAATEELCRHYFGQLVEVAIGERENIRRKPAPDTVLEALRQLGVGRDDAVYVGDSEVDIATAANSQLPCISVLWGFRDRDFLLRHHAECFISSPQELL